MFRNNLKIAFRNFARHKGVSFINIFGLACGMACSLMIVLFIRDELSYDRFNQDSDRVYRVAKDFVNDDGTRLPDATTPPGLAPALQSEVPGVEYVTRVFPGWGGKYLLQYQDKHFMEDRLFRVDSSFFDVFTFPFIEGNAKSAFQHLNSIVLTEDMARKYFGSADPMGKTIHVEGPGDLMVSGVVKDVPEHAHFHFDFLISTKKFSGDIDQNWGWYNFYTYVKFAPRVNLSGMTAKVQALYKEHDKEGHNIFYIQPLTGIHLDSHLKWEIEPNGDRLYVYVFSIIGIFVMLVACINYVNLATAKSALRAKEIGVRKAAGAFRSSLVKQFLVESLLTASLSMGAALILTLFLLPYINHLTGKALSLTSLSDPLLLGGLLVSVLLLGLISGLYPALFLSSFKPVLVLKGLRGASGKGTFNLRRALVVLQFSISVALIAGTLIIIRQVNYIRDARLGLNKDQVVILDNTATLSYSQKVALQDRLRSIPGVTDAATSNGVVGGLNWTMDLNLKGSKNSQLINFLNVGYDYLKVLDISIASGRNFSPDFPSDTMNEDVKGGTERIIGGIIINEKAARDLGIHGSPIDQLLAYDKNNDTVYYVKVVGVTRDFHFASFHNEIKPFAFKLVPNWGDNITLKIGPGNVRETIARMQNAWTSITSEYPFQYSFLDQTFAHLYQSEERFNTIFLYLTVLAILIACLGLFGLTAFSIEQRTKEIGIRKVLGASVPQIVTLVSRDFIRLVLVAILIACPVSWYFMHQWLQNFAYRATLEWWVFGVAGLLGIGIAILTVSIQAFRAASVSPVKSLHAE